MLTNSSLNPFAAALVPPSVIDFPGNLHVHSTVVHHVHGPLLQGRSIMVEKMISLLQNVADLASKPALILHFSTYS